MNDKTTLYPYKETLASVVQDKLISIIEEKKWSQKKVVDLCESNGYQITQPELSKLINKKASLSVNQLFALSNILDISIDELVRAKDDGAFLLSSGKFLAVNPEEEEFVGFTGTFQTVFMSTDIHDEKVLRGDITFEKSGKICRAEFHLLTGVLDQDGKEVVKIYQGQLIMSKKLSTAYCILYNEQIGELSFIEFRRRDFVTKQAKCRIGLCMTASAGENKIPVAHRMILTRDFLMEDDCMKLRPLLSMGGKDILIPKRAIENLADSHKEYQEIFDMLLSSGLEESYLMASVGIVEEYGKRKRMSQVEIAKCLTCLMEVAETPMHYRLTEWDDSLVYAMLRGFESLPETIKE